jgi:TniQ
VSGPQRWPLHPQPAPGEALSSWLTRLAGVYGLSVEDLLQHNLGPASFEVGDRNAGGLDRDPPAAVLAALHDRTGVPRDQPRQMTIAGWVPWLLDSIDPADDPSAFTTYVRQDSVLLGPGEAVARHVPGWRAWLPATPLRRACPKCMDDPGRGFTLLSQLPLTVSCPEHGLRLEATFGSLGAFIAWQADDTQPTQANEQVVAMDRRTHEGLTTGMVTLPRRSVHLGVWFRLLRTLLDELGTPTAQLRSPARSALRRIWQATGRPRPAAQRRWRPYEALDWPRQQAMLEAAAAALHLIEAGDVTARGTLGPLLRVEPHQPVPDGRPLAPPPKPVDHWNRALDELRTAVEEAQQDPEAARRLLELFTALCRTRSCFDRIRESLIGAGVPRRFLPDHLDR